jgi:hypothetical protein
MPFKSVAAKYFISNGKAFFGYYQGYQYLGLLRLVVFGKAVLSQLVFFKGLKV